MESVPLDAALGRTLAATVESRDAVPGFDNSAMDGFALRAADTDPAADGRSVALRVAGESRAGAPASARVEEGEAIRISTGAMIPAGADAVARVEDCREADGAVEVLARVAQGENVRRAGEDIAAGDVLLEPGTVIGAAELGVAASVGVEALACSRRPRVRVLTTGDELVAPGQPLEPGQIRNTNAYTIAALVDEIGAELAGAEHAPDDYDAVLAAVRRGLDADVLVTCGGVSVGEHDHLKAAFREAGVEEVFWGVALRPGHPTWFGTAPDGQLVFGLPGNPVSAMVTFHLFARPALAASLGQGRTERRATAVMDADYAKRPGRAHVVRCRLEARDDGWHVVPTREQGSHILTSMLGAEALALLAVERGDVRAGERVEIELI